MKNENKAMFVVVAYILVMLIICVVAIMAIRKEPSENSDLNDSATETTPPVTEVIYIPIYSDTETPDTETPENVTYTVKSHQGKIGVFSETGELTDIIDIYIKTLPEADRRLLEEGFEVNSEAELRSVIEDYTA